MCQINAYNNNRNIKVLLFLLCYHLKIQKMLLSSISTELCIMRNTFFNHVIQYKLCNGDPHNLHLKSCINMTLYSQNKEEFALFTCFANVIASFPEMALFANLYPTSIYVCYYIHRKPQRQQQTYIVPFYPCSHIANVCWLIANRG